MGFINTSLSEWNEPASIYPKKGRKSNGHLSLKKPINSHKAVQRNETTNPKSFSKNMHNFLKIWHIKEIKNIFFPSVYMKMNWTFNYLRVMRRIRPIFWKKERKKEREKKRERKKTKIFFSIYFFFYMYIWKWARRIGQFSDFILICLNRSG